MEKFYNRGIDTVCLIVDTEYSDKEIDRLKTKYPVLKIINKTSLTNDGKYKAMVFQPSNYVDRSKLIDNGSLFLGCISKALKILDGKIISVNRIDISLDSNKELNSYKQLARLIILCISANKKIKKAFTVNGLFDLKEKTVKLVSDRFVVTFYCREDKTHHGAASRLEIRYQKLSQTDLKIELKKKIKNTFDLFSKVEEGLEEVQKKVIPVLIDLYHDEMQSGTLVSFSRFMDKYGEFVYTKEMFDEIYKESHLTGSSSKWLEKFRKTRDNTFKFQSKNSVRKFSKEVKKHLKEYTKTF